MSTLVRTLFFLSFLLFPWALSAQPSEVIEQSFGVEVMPYFGDRRITGGQGIIFTELERQDSLESGVGGFGFGLLYESRVNKIGFSTGVRYLETGYDVAEQNLRDTGLRFSDEVRARYLSIPFELNFHQSITDKDRVSFTLGTAANLHLKTTRNRTTLDEDGMVLTTEEAPENPNTKYRSPVMSFTAGIAYDRKFNDRWAIKIQPAFQFFLQGNQKEAVGQTNRNYYQLGARVFIKRFF